MTIRTMTFGVVTGATAVGAILMANSFVRAQTDSAYRLGVVDMDRVLQSYDAGHQRAGALREAFESREGEVRTQVAQLEVRRDAFRDEAARLSASQRETQARKLEDAMYELQQQMRRVESDQVREFQRLELQLRRDIQRAIDAIAAEDDYHLIFQKTNEETSDIVFASPTVNITPKLIDRLNQ